MGCAVWDWGGWEFRAGASSRNTPSRTSPLPYIHPEHTVDGGNLAPPRAPLLQLHGFVILWFVKVSLHQQYPGALSLEIIPTLGPKPYK